MKGKKILSTMLLTLFAMLLVPVSALANILPTKEVTMPLLSEADLIFDTSNPEIGLAFFIGNELQTRAYQKTERTGEGYFYEKPSMKTLGKFKCTGYFSYDGTICNVTDVDVSHWEVANGWKVIEDSSDSQISPTYACATGVFELYKVGIFGDSLSSSATINVFCNQNGKTSVEFNGDE